MIRKDYSLSLDYAEYQTMIQALELLKQSIFNEIQNNYDGTLDWGEVWSIYTESVCYQLLERLKNSY